MKIDPSQHRDITFCYVPKIYVLKTYPSKFVSLKWYRKHLLNSQATWWHYLQEEKKNHSGLRFLLSDTSHWKSMERNLWDNWEKKGFHVQPRFLLSIKATNSSECATTQEILLTYQGLSFNQSRNNRKFSKTIGGKHLMCLIELRLKEICGLDTKTEHKFYMSCHFKKTNNQKFRE